MGEVIDRFCARAETHARGQRRKLLDPADRHIHVVAKYGQSGDYCILLTPSARAQQVLLWKSLGEVRCCRPHGAELRNFLS